MSRSDAREGFGRFELDYLFALKCKNSLRKVMMG